MKKWHQKSVITHKKFLLNQLVNKIYEIEVVGNKNNISHALNEITNQNFNQGDSSMMNSIINCFNKYDCTVIQSLEDENKNTQGIDYFDEYDMED